MAKKVAVLVVNPVNGSGLFQYLETFFENGIPFRTFAVADTTNVKTNSGLRLQTDDVITSLKGHEHEYDALVFACGDAMPKFAENADKPYNVDMLSVIKNFAAQGKTIAGQLRRSTALRQPRHRTGQTGGPASVPQTGRQKLYRNGRKSRHRRHLLHGTEREYDFLPAARTVESPEIIPES